MRNATLYYLLSALLLSISACKKDADVVTLDNSGLCAPASSYALPVTDLEGVVNFNQTLQQYVVSRVIPGTYDSVDIGVICGELPADFKATGTKVRFSGIYHGYGQNPAPPAGPAGTTYYYLELSTIAKL
jgi:hypothetical protein